MKELLGEARIEADLEVGVSIRTLEEEVGPLSSYTPLVDKVKGNLFLPKYWHDLEL